MPTEYEKQLEAENEGLRKTIRTMEDDIFNMEDTISKYKNLLTLDDMRRILITSINQTTPAQSTVNFHNRKFHLYGRTEITMQLSFDDSTVAMKFKQAVEESKK